MKNLQILLVPNNFFLIVALASHVTVNSSEIKAKPNVDEAHSSFGDPYAEAPSEHVRLKVQSSCPHGLLKQIFEKDQAGSWLSLMANHKPQDCTKNIIDRFANAQELDQELRKALGADLNTLNSLPSIQNCLAGPEYVGAPEALKKSAVAEFYLINARLDGGGAQYLRLAREASLVLNQPMPDVAEPSVYMPDSRNEFKRIKGESPCAQRGQLAKLSEETAEVLNMIRALNKSASLDPTKIEHANKAVAAIKRSFPWLLSPELSPLTTELAGGPNESVDLLKGISLYFTRMRDDAKNQFNRFAVASACVNGASDTNCYKEHSKTIDEAPEFDLSPIEARVQQTAKNLSTEDVKRVELVKTLDALNRFQSGICIQRIRKAKGDMAQVMTETSLNVGLTLATFGTGSLMSASTAIGKGAMAARATRSARLWQSMSKARITPLHKTLSQYGPALQAARGVALGADIASFGQGLEQMAEACTENEAQLKINGAATRSNPTSCENLILKAQVFSAARNCMAASLAAATGLLPFVPAVLSRTLKGGAQAEKANVVAIGGAASDAKIVRKQIVPAPAIKTADAVSQTPPTLEGFIQAGILRPFDGMPGFTQVAYDTGVKLRNLPEAEQATAAQFLLNQMAHAEKTADALVQAGNLDGAILEASKLQYFSEMRQTLLREGGMQVNTELLERATR